MMVLILVGQLRPVSGGPRLRNVPATLAGKSTVDKRMRGKSLVEVVLVFGLLVLLVALYKATGLARVEKDLFGLSYFGAVQILIPVVILLFARRSFGSYGITTERWRYNLSVGLTAFPVSFISFIPLGLLPIIGTNYLEPLGALVLSGCCVLEIIIITSILRRGEHEGDQESAGAGVVASVSAKEVWKARRNLVLLVVLLALPILLALYVKGLSDFNTNIVHSVIFQFFISGFGEEIMFRGYVQSRVNQEFGRPYKFLGISFGIGLFVSSFLFGFLHILNSFSPFTGSFGLLPWWGVWTFFGGLFFGLIREKTGSIISVGIAHGLPDAVGESIVLLAGAS